MHMISGIGGRQPFCCMVSTAGCCQIHNSATHVDIDIPIAPSPRNWFNLQIHVLITTHLARNNKSQIQTFVCSFENTSVESQQCT